MNTTAETQTAVSDSPRADPRQGPPRAVITPAGERILRTELERLRCELGGQGAAGSWAARRRASGEEVDLLLLGPGREEPAGRVVLDRTSKRVIRSPAWPVLVLPSASTEVASAEDMGVGRSAAVTSL